MDFSKVDILQVLKSAIPKKFQDFSPQDFEDFIAQLFRDNEYQVEQTKYSGDYGADLIIIKNGVKFAVQIKRYSETNKVGVQDINQVIGAKDYYNCDGAMVITTSSYTYRGKLLAKETNIELWEWDELLNNISKTYWNGKDYYTFYKNDIINRNNNNENFKIIIKKIKKYVPLEKGGVGTVIFVDVTNISNKNIYLEFDLASFITNEFKQIEADYKLSTCFVGGIVYAGCTVEIGYIFLNNKITSLNKGDKLVSKFYEKTNENDEPIKNVYITTYGDSRESMLLESFHDEHLKYLKINIDKLEKEIENKNNIIKSLNEELYIFKNKTSKMEKYIDEKDIRIKELEENIKKKQYISYLLLLLLIIMILSFIIKITI